MAKLPPFNVEHPRTRVFSQRKHGRNRPNRFEIKRMVGPVVRSEKRIKSTVDKLLESMTPEERLEFDREYEDILADEERLKREYERTIGKDEARNPDNSE